MASQGVIQGPRLPYQAALHLESFAFHCWMAKEIWKPEMGGVGWEGRFGVMHTTSTHIHWMQLSHLTDPTAGKTGKWSYFCDQEGKKKKKQEKDLLSLYEELVSQSLVILFIYFLPFIFFRSVPAA